MKEETITKTYRIPTHLFEILDKEAKSDRRSQNSMMVVILEQWAKAKQGKAA